MWRALVVAAGLLSASAADEARSEQNPEVPAGAGTVSTPSRTVDRAGSNSREGNIHLHLRRRIDGSGVLPHGQVMFAGVVAPGNSPGCVEGENLVFDANSTLVIEIGGTTPCAEHDRLTATDQLSPGGATLELRLVDDFVPIIGDSFDVLDWGTIAGTFGATEISLALLPPGLAWNFDALHLDGTITVQAVGLAAVAVPLPAPATAALALLLSLAAFRARCRA